MTTSGFPNLFYLYGPQSPSGFCNGPTCAEIQGDWVVNTIDYMETNKFKKIEADPDAEVEYRKHIDTLVSATLFANTKRLVIVLHLPMQRC
jgi:hypothetical protein